MLFSHYNVCYTEDNIDPFELVDQISSCPWDESHLLNENPL